MNQTRIQLSRKKGWRLPPNTIVVSRPTKWGNPFVVSTALTALEAVKLFKARVEQNDWPANIRKKLRGHNLACWCPLDQPCHADVLLEIANS